MVVGPNSTSLNKIREEREESSSPSVHHVHLGMSGRNICGESRVGKVKEVGGGISGLPLE